MSNVKTTLKELVRYFDSTRGIGHTTAVIAGAENVDNCLVIAANIQDVHRLAEGDLFKVMTLAELGDGKMRGRACPVVLDNHALAELARQSLTEIARLEEKINGMKIVAQAIADINLYD